MNSDDDEDEEDYDSQEHLRRKEVRLSHIRTRKNLTSCSKSASKSSTSCVRIACPKLSTSLEQAVNNL